VNQSIKHRTVAIQESIQTGKRGPLRHFDTRTYIQHNLALGDGFGSLLEFLDSLPAGTSRVEAIRAFEDGDISFAHLEYFLEPLGDVIGFEVHRWHDGRIVEHWDNLQPRPATTNPSGRTMTDGHREVADLDRTETNKELVATFVAQVLIGGETEALRRYVDDALIEHTPNRGDGAHSLQQALARQIATGSLRYRNLHRLLGEGNFVLTMCEGEMDGDPAALYDLSRLEDGSIMEHWDVVEPIPERSAWANDNGKF